MALLLLNAVDAYGDGGIYVALYEANKKASQHTSHLMQIKIPFNGKNAFQDYKMGTAIDKSLVHMQ